MTDPAHPLSSEESAAWVRLIAVAQLLPVALDAQLQRDDGLTHFEYVALMALAGGYGLWMEHSTSPARTEARVVAQQAS